MKTLIAYYSKTGNTRAVAEKTQAALSCDMDEIKYNEGNKAIASALDPADYESVILMCPIWAFNLPEPMALYLRQYKAGIKRYRLAVTYGLFGLRGCVSGCKKILGAAPEKAVSINAKKAKSGAFDVGAITADL